MENRSLVTIAEHSKEKILYMLEMAKAESLSPTRWRSATLRETVINPPSGVNL